MSVTLFGFEIPVAILALGVITGLTYGLLAVGLVLVYRSNKVINFAHGEIGALGAALLGLAVVRWRLPYWIGFLLAIAVSAGTGALTEVAVVRRLRKAPRLMSLVATLGVAQVLLLMSAVLNGQATAGGVFPEPSGLPRFHIGVLLVTPAHSGMLFFGPVIVLALATFLRRNRYGLAIRGAAANRERARLSGIFAGRMSTLVWAIAGALAAFTAIVIVPTRGFITTETLGPNLLLRALAAAVLARMESLPIALLAGLGVGVIEATVIFNYPSGALPELVLFALILGALLFQSRQGAREGDRGEAWAAVQPWPAVSQSLRAVFAIRHLGMGVAVFTLALGLALGVLVTNTAAISLTVILAFSLVGLSLGVITGLSGQLSLGQFALAGVGAIVSTTVVAQTGNFLLGFGSAALGTAAASVVIGLPALRIRGIMLAVTTLGFALASRWIFQQSWALGEGRVPGRPIFGSFALDTSKRYFVFALVVFAIGLWLARNVWRSGLGLKLRATRDNEDSARAFGVSAVRMKLQAFVLAGVLAGLGGAVYAHMLSRVGPGAFDVVTSLNIVALTVLGGIGLLAGPVLGALYIVGIPTFVPLDSAGLAATAAGWLLLVLYFPGGIAQIIGPIRARVIGGLARRAGVDRKVTESEARSTDMALSDARVIPPKSQRRGRRDEILLRVDDVTKHYGGVKAVDGVSLSVHSGEILGLMGPNGAGKTTTFELVSGFVSPDSGSVEFVGKNITNLTPEERTHAGLVRSFQDARLFPTLTVTESVALAYQLASPSHFLLSVLSLDRNTRRNEERARELIGLIGLDAFRHKQVRELSTGTRRVTELACMMALQPRLLLLDEPSSGIAQRESEALGELLLDLKRSLDTTMIIIEHDIPLLMSLADRVVAMDAGCVISEGSPSAVQKDPVVIEAYLGADLRAIERSGEATGTELGRCQATTREAVRCSRKASKDGLCSQHQVSEKARA